MIAFDNRFIQLPAAFWRRQLPSPLRNPRLLAVNTTLLHELGIGVTETAHGDAHGISQAGHIHCAGGDLRSHIPQLVRLGTDLRCELLAGRMQSAGRCSDQAVDDLALLGGCVVDRVQ